MPEGYHSSREGLSLCQTGTSFFSLMKKTKQKKSRLRSQPSFFSNVAKLKKLTAFKQLSILTLLSWEKSKNIHKAEIKLKPFRPFFLIEASS